MKYIGNDNIQVYVYDKTVRIQVDEQQALIIPVHVARDLSDQLKLALDLPERKARDAI